jgi:hypothetical protein
MVVRVAWLRAQATIAADRVEKGALLLAAAAAAAADLPPKQATLPLVLLAPRTSRPWAVPPGRVAVLVRQGGLLSALAWALLEVTQAVAAVGHG